MKPRVFIFQFRLVNARLVSNKGCFLSDCFMTSVTINSGITIYCHEETVKYLSCRKEYLFIGYLCLKLYKFVQNCFLYVYMHIEVHCIYWETMFCKTLMNGKL